MTNEHSHPTPSSIRDDSICESSLHLNKSSGDIVELKPCRKCGCLDFELWDGRGTQAYLFCNECGQEEGVQVVDLFDQAERPVWGDKLLCYPPHAVKRANEHLIEEWNTRTPDPESDAEIERLRRERDEARTIVVEANNSLYGSQGYFHSTNGGPFDKYHLARPIEELKSRARDALTAESAVAAAWEEAARVAKDRWREWRSSYEDDLDGMDACEDISKAISARASAIRAAHMGTTYKTKKPPPR